MVQIPFVKAQVQRGVNVIAISPNSPDALNQVLDRARKKGILVLSVNGDMTGNEEYRDAAILPTDSTAPATHLPPGAPDERHVSPRVGQAETVIDGGQLPLAVHSCCEYVAAVAVCVAQPQV